MKLQKQLDDRYPQPQHIIEYTHDLIQRGKLNFDKSENDDRTVTFHDSCNVARATNMGGIEGGQFILPREVIKAVCNNYVDMERSTIKESTFCCGGGGGLLTDDLMEIRVKGAMPRMQALKEVESVRILADAQVGKEVDIIESEKSAASRRIDEENKAQITRMHMITQAEARKLSSEHEAEATLTRAKATSEAQKITAEGVERERDQLDRKIETCSTNWRMSRMSPVDRNILRLAAYELIHMDDVPSHVTLNEAIELAKKFGTAQSKGFVNGILDRLAREAGQL
jgi:transcription antitermination factor NusB